MNLKQALASLDPANNDHWTEDGDPRLAVLVTLTGVQVTRDDINVAAPGFRRPGKKPVEGPAETEKEDEVTDDQGGEEVSLGDIKDKLAASALAVEAAEKQLNDAKDAVHHARQVHDKLLVQSESLKTPADKFKPFADHIKRSQEERAKRAGRISDIRQFVARLDTGEKNVLRRKLSNGRTPNGG